MTNQHVRMLPTPVSYRPIPPILIPSWQLTRTQMWPTKQKKKTRNRKLFSNIFLCLCAAFQIPISLLGISKRFHIQVGDIDSPSSLSPDPYPDPVSAFYADSSCGYNFNGQIAAGELVPRPVGMEIAFPLFPFDFATESWHCKRIKTNDSNAS